LCCYRLIGIGVEVNRQPGVVVARAAKSEIVRREVGIEVEQLVYGANIDTSRACSRERRKFELRTTATQNR
jgi:hypothetical protein